MGRCEKHIEDIRALIKANDLSKKRNQKKFKFLRKKLDMERLCYRDVENTPEQKETVYNNIQDIIKEILETEQLLKLNTKRSKKFFKEIRRIKKDGLEYINKKTQWKENI